MKKLIIFSILFSLTFTSISYADNSKRITELNQEATQLQERLVQYQEIARNIQIRLIQINAIVEELKSQDLKAKEEEIKAK